MAFSHIHSINEQSEREHMLSKLGEIEVVYRRKCPQKISERPQIKNSKDIYKILRKCWDPNKIDLQEEFKVLLLNTANRVLCLYNASFGGCTGTVVDIRLILAAAIQVNATRIVICHNHPSANLEPSLADQHLTEKVNYACKYHDISLVDHIIISSEGYFSFADDGLL